MRGDMVRRYSYGIGTYLLHSKMAHNVFATKGHDQPMKQLLQSALSKPSGLLDAVGRKALRFYLYRENNSFDPDRNGEHNFLDLLRKNGFQPTVILDIGANEGRWSDHVSKIWPAARVHLFEPVASVVARLQSRFAGDDRFAIHQCAVGEADAVVAVREDVETSSHSSISADLGSATESVELVSSARLLELVESQTIGLLKIDTEGYDLTILRGLQSLLSSHAIDVIQFEHHALTASYQIPFCDTISLLEASGYRCGKIFPEGIRRVKAGPTEWSHLVGPNFVAFAPQTHALMERLVTR